MASSHTTNGFLQDDGSGNLSWQTIAGAGGVTGTGTTNYVARWTGTSALGTGVLVDNGTNVGLLSGNLGIGTTNPTSSLTFGSAATVGLASSAQALNFQSGLLDLDTTNSRVGIGTTAPTAKLEVTGDITLSSGADRVISLASSSGNVLTIRGSNGVSGGGTPGGNLVLQAGNSITAGTGGSVNISSGSSTSGDSGNVNIGVASGGNQDGHITLGYNGTRFGGNVGIGTSAPSALLSVGSTSQFQINSSGNFTWTGAATATIASSSTTALNFKNGVTSYLDFDTTNSRVGIGTTAPTVKLDVNGQVRVGTLSGTASNALCYDSSNILTPCAASSSLSGSGTSGQATFWSGTNTLLGDNSFFWTIPIRDWE